MGFGAVPDARTMRMIISGKTNAARYPWGIRRVLHKLLFCPIEQHMLGWNDGKQTHENFDVCVYCGCQCFIDG